MVSLRAPLRARFRRFDPAAIGRHRAGGRAELRWPRGGTAILGTLCALLIVAMASSHWSGVGAAQSRREPSVAAASTPAARAAADPLAELRAWDRRRAAAWAATDPVALQRLYRQGSVAGAKDVALLRRYRREGWRVEGLTPQIVRAAIVGRSAQARVVELRDRLPTATLISSTGRREPTAATPLRWRQVLLCRVAGRWVVAEVLAVAAPRGRPVSGAAPDRCSPLR